MYTDPISDFLTRIRNASAAKKPVAEIPYSQMKEEIGKIIEEEGFVEKCRVDRTGKFPILRVTLKSARGTLNLKRVSKPGCRSYSGKEGMKTFRHGYGIQIVTTSRGIMTSQKAREEGIGGEILCEIY